MKINAKRMRRKSHTNPILHSLMLHKKRLTSAALSELPLAARRHLSHPVLSSFYSKYYSSLVVY